jgi:homocysteine S-methyltransferase
MAGRIGRAQVGAALSSGTAFLTFPGVETYMLFEQQFPLRDFCAFEVFEDDEAWQELSEAVLVPTVRAAAAGGHGLITDALVWRASPDHVSNLGYTTGDVERINREAVARVDEAVSAAAVDTPLIFAGEVGPRGDGYALAPGEEPGASSAREYHMRQIVALAGTDIALLSALTMTNAEEAIGIVQAAAEVGIPTIVSPTVETDGRLPSGMSLAEFVARVDGGTHGYPLFYMVNCAHPTHLSPALAAAVDRGESWLARFRGFRANASSKSHEELDNSTELDRGSPGDLAEQVAAMRAAYGLTVVGGCCGTDVEHIERIAEAVSGASSVEG